MSELQNFQARANIIGGMIFAVENAESVFGWCARSSPDHAVTARELAHHFGVSELQAEAILDMPVRRFSPHAVASMRSELQALESQIQDLSS